MSIKSLSEIMQDLINNIHDTLPDIDTKQGTFINDVFINPTASEIAALYDEIYMTRMSQSVLTAIGTDLDNLASNYFISRKLSTSSSGTVRFYIKSPINNPIIIPAGTNVGTVGTTTNPQMVFQTVQDVVVTQDVALTDPTMPGLVYIETTAQSTFTGSTANVEAFTITVILDSIDSNITQVENPLPFAGGMDAESDLSLALRVSLAVSGANIGTKDGYQAFILKQQEVVDAIVVGAGDPLMTRDHGQGGMVDIYVRSERIAQDTYTYTVSKDYVTNQLNQPAYSNIILPNQPVLGITLLSGEIDGNQKSYIDGSNYDVENGTQKYFEDVLWTFTAPTPTSTPTPQDVATTILNQKLANVNYLTNIFYDLNWSFITYAPNTSTPDPDFLRGYYPDDNQVYIIQSKDDPNSPYIGGRYFVMQDGQIYERIYYNPDFILNRDITDYGYSIDAKDSIEWLSGGINKPGENEILTIKYTYNGAINDLQSGLDSVRVLTADVLIKSARRVGVEIYADVVPFISYDPTTVQTNVISRVATFINNIKNLGGTLDISDIAYIIRGTDGVAAVGLDTLKLARTNGPALKQLVANEYEYLETDMIVISMKPAGSVV